MAVVLLRKMGIMSHHSVYCEDLAVLRSALDRIATRVLRYTVVVNKV